MTSLYSLSVEIQTGLPAVFVTCALSYTLTSWENFVSVYSQITKRIEGIDVKNKELVAKYKKEMTLRKKLHNELVDLKGNIRVYCRVRPVIKEDGVGKNAENVISFDEDDDALLNVFSKGAIKLFEMDKVFRPESTQEQVRNK